MSKQRMSHIDPAFRYSMSAISGMISSRSGIHPTTFASKCIQVLRMQEVIKLLSIMLQLPPCDHFGNQFPFYVTVKWCFIHLWYVLMYSDEEASRYAYCIYPAITKFSSKQKVSATEWMLVCEM